MRKCLILLLCLLLCGCDYVANNDVERAFDFEEQESTVRANNITKYYSYYLPSDVQEEVKDSETVVLTYNNSQAVMNLNIPSIINNRFYTSYVLRDDGFFDDDKLVYTRESKYLDNNEDQISYIYNLYNYGDQYLIHFMSSIVNFYGYAYQNDVAGLTSKMLLIAKSVETNKDDVINDYSSKDVINYEKKQINLFDLVLPVNGKLEELFID